MAESVGFIRKCCTLKSPFDGVNKHSGRQGVFGLCWWFESSKIVVHLIKHSCRVSTANLLVSGSYDRTVALWDTSSLCQSLLLKVMTLSRSLQS